jgi:hypothetical protein
MNDGFCQAGERQLDRAGVNTDLFLRACPWQGH